MLGLVFDGTPNPGTVARVVKNFASGTPPQLTIVYAVKSSPPPLPPTQR